MVFDSLVANPGRLRILTALVIEPRQDFTRLRSLTRLTDGNLAAHARRLELAGMISVDKLFREGKPVTSYALTRTGREALESHARALMTALERIDLADVTAEAAEPIAAPSAAEDWVD